MHDAVTAALELDLLQHLEDGTALTSGAADYARARDAATHGDHAASLQHLERSIRANSAYAEAAQHDTAFDAARGPVRDLVSRLTVVARIRAEAVIEEARSAVELAPAEYDAARDAAVRGDQSASLQHLERSILMNRIFAEAAQDDAAFGPLRGAVLELLGRMNLPALSGAEAAIEQASSAVETAASEYQQARDAAASGNQSVSLQHLEHSILANPAYAEAARHDPAFEGMRDAVHDLVNRVSLPERVRAEAVIEEARSAIESDPAAHVRNAMQLAQAWLDMAQAHFQAASYTGYLLAAEAAAVAQQIASRPYLVRPVARVNRGPRTRTRPVPQAVSRLWQRLPLLVILLIWLLAGIVAGLASLPFQEGSIAEWRQTLFPIWALGLLGMVVLGFLRSIRRLLRRRG